MKIKTIVLCAATFVVAAVCDAGTADDSGDVTGLADLKPLAMRVYGVRSVKVIDASTVKVNFGCATVDMRRNAGAYRIISEDDADYAYEKFVKPTEVKAGKEAVEFPYPPGFAGHPKAQQPMMICDCTLTLPTPLKSGCHYAVLAQGEGSGQITCGTCAAKFTFGKADPAWDSEDVAPFAARMMGLRRVSALGDGKLLCEFGHDYSQGSGLKLANWSVTVNGEKVEPLAIGRRAVLECYKPTGWGGQFGTFLYNNIFLDIGRELKDGDVVKVSVAEAVTSAANEASFTFVANRSLTRAIKTNQIGYLPDDIKVAYLGFWLGSFPESGAVSATKQADAPVEFSFAQYYAEAGKGTQEDRANAAAAEKKAKEEAEAAALEAAKVQGGAAYNYDTLAPYALRFKTLPKFSLCDEKTGKAVFTGEAKFVHNGFDDDYRGNMSAENVYTLDFTSFTKPGRYYLSIDGVGRSLAFEIGPDVYLTAFRGQAQGVYEQRCGCELDPKLTGGWKRVACHNHGLTTTKVGRWTVGAFGPFLENIETDPNPAYPPVKAAREKVENDPSLVKGIVWKPRGATKQEQDPAPGVTWTTGEGDENGVEAKYAIDPAKGATISWWSRRIDSFGANDWHGDFYSIGGQKTFSNFAIWGTIHGVGRISDRKWWHMVLRIGPADEKGVSSIQYIVNGRDTKEHSHGVKLANGDDSIVFGAIRGKAAEGTSFRDIRIYSRSLSDKELADLTANVPETLPHVIEGIGGHHDAGDYNPRSHIDVAQALMNAYELKPGNFTDGQLPIPEAGNGIPDIIDEALWAVKIWEALQDTDGGVRNGTESNGDPNLIQTVELDDRGDYTYAKDTKGTYLACGVFAQTSRILGKLGRKAEAKTYLERAKRAYEWALKNPTEGLKSLGQYGEYNLSLRAYAAAELYHTTWEKRYHEDFVATTPWKTVENCEVESYGYFELRPAAYAYVLIPREKADPIIWNRVLGSIRKQADMYIRGSDRMAYKFLLHPYAPVTWGTGAYENYAVEAAFMWCLTGEKTYRDWMIRTCDNTLGANPIGISYITGLGARTIRCPLHNSRYRVEGVAVDGLHGQGPNEKAPGYAYTDTVYPWHKDKFANLQELADVHFCIAMDEPTVNNMVNTMFIFGLLR